MELHDQEAKERQLRDVQYLRDRDSERQRQHELRLKEMEISSARDREHAERMMQLSMQRAEVAKSDGIGNMLTAGLTLLEKADMDLKDVMGMIRGGAESAGWADLLGTLAERVGSVAEKAIEAKVDAQAAQLEGQQMAAIAQQPQPPGMVMVPQQLLQQGAFPQAGGIPGAPMGYVNPYGQEQQMQAPQEFQQAIPMPQQPGLAQAAPATSLGLQAQKTARVAIRWLLEALQTTPETEWEGAIAAAIGTEMTIYHYIQDVSVVYAMREAGADDAFVTKIVQALQASALVPNDIRYE